MKTPKSEPRDEVPVEEQDLVTNQEAVAVPWFQGTRRIALIWLDAARAGIFDKIKQRGKK